METFVLFEPSPALGERPSSSSSKFLSLLAGFDLSCDLQVCGGLQEAGVAVFLHQGVDLGLSQVKAGLCGLLHVLLGDGFGGVVQVHLWRREDGSHPPGRRASWSLAECVMITSRGASERTNSS